MKFSFLKKLLPGLIGLSALALLGRLLGVVREVLMASKFGATQITDAYLITLILFDIAMAANSSILSGTLSYSTEIKKIKNFTRPLFKLGIKAFFVVLIIAIILYPVMGWVVPLIFSKSIAAAQVVVETSRLLLVLAAFLVACGVFSALLQLNGDITNPGRLVVFLNIASITSLIFFSKYVGIISLPIGLLSGGILFFIYQIFLIRRIEKKSFGYLGNEQLNVTEWGKIILLIFGNSLLPSVSGLIERFFAYYFAAGTFSHYQYAAKIILLPLTIFSFAISTSLLPIQTKSMNAGNMRNFMSATTKGILISVVTSCLFVLLFAVLSQPIIHLIYQRGHFTSHDSFETSLALQIMSIGLIPFLLNPIIANIYYSLRIVKSLISINMSFIMLQAIMLFLFSRVIPGIEALTIAWVIISWFNSVALIYYLVRVRNIHFDKTIIFKLFLVVLFASIFIFLGKNLAKVMFVDMNTINNDWQLLIRVIGAGLVLVIIFGSTVYFIFRDMLRNGNL